ncbi:hypothetical protein [Actinoplanes sp. DH11]|uniref:hypothetical protein n=1 Tax=Actinoplanes sp. DH11 TaxID=2857011 RepID=UPI001E4CA152|nr:hypothetical protein [Actinoplanes sp. DH11]
MTTSAASHGDYSPTIQQNGTVHGDTNIYYASPDDTPERKYEVALRRLDAGMTRFAEELLAEVLRTGRGGNPDVLYHYLVAALSERSLADLDSWHHQALATAHQMISTSPGTAGEDLSRLRNLMALVALASRVNDHGQLSAADSERMRQAYQCLPLEHQRALDTLLAGPGKDTAAREYANQVRARRGADIVNRTQRVWKFFEADPAPPREVRRPLPVIAPAVRAAGIGGAALLVLGLVGLLVQISTAGDAGALAGGLILAAAGAALGPGTSWRRARDRELLCLRQARLDGSVKLSDLFSKDLHSVLNATGAAFDEVGRGDHAAWQKLTAGLRTTLAYEFLTAYEPDDVLQGRLTWLARWHARQTLEQAQAGTLLEFQETYRERPGLKRAGRAGIALLVIAALILYGALGPGASALPWLAAVTGTVLIWRPFLTALGRQSAHQVAGRWSIERFAAEQAEWERWSGVLRDRPTDAEIAAWLADDIDVFKADIMEERGIRPSEVLYTVELATADAPTRRARQAYGPIRYSRYLLTIFLLTPSGLRQFQAHLDLGNGEIEGEQRRSVPYGALREVQVEQRSVRLPQTAAIPGQYAVEPAGVAGPAITSDVVISHRRFVIRLDSGGTFEIELGGFEGLQAGSEPKDMVARLALEATGAEAALHVLETVVVDGAEWLTKEQARRRHAAIDDLPSEPPALPPDSPELPPDSPAPPAH